MKLPHRNDRSRRAVVAHHSRVDSVHRRPQLDVRDVNGHLEDSSEVAAGGFEDLSDVLQALLGLFFDRTGEACSGVWIDSDWKIRLFTRLFRGWYVAAILTPCESSIFLFETLPPKPLQATIRLS
jgi:hypothetical protein